MGTTPTEKEAYDAFVDTCMHQLHAGLQLDHTDKKQRVASALQTHVLNKQKRAAQRVLEGRFVLGADDSAYLQTGMATLWSTAPTDASTDGLDKGLALAPPGLYTPEAVGGIRAGLVRALKAKTKALERNAPADLAALVPALRLLLETPVIRKAVIGGDITQPVLGELLKYKWTDVAKDAERETRRTELLEVLRKLKTYLESAKGRKGGAKRVTDLILGAIEKQARDLAKSESISAKRFNAIGTLRQQLNRAKASLQAVKIERDKQADLAKTRGAQLKSTRVEIARLEAELVDCNKQREVLGAMFATNQAALNEKHAAVEACEQREATLVGELKRCEKDKARLNVELTTERQIKKEREESFRTEKAEVEKMLKQCQTEKATLKREKAVLANEKVTLGQQVHRLQVRESQLADAIAKAGSRERALEATLEDKKAKLASCEAEEVRLNAVLTAQGEQFSTLKRLLGEKELAAEKCEEALKAREAAQAVLQAQTASDIQDYEGKLTAAHNSRAEAAREWDKAIQRIVEWEDRVDQLGVELDVSRTGSEALKAEMETMEAEMETMEAELAKMKKTRNAALRKRRQLSDAVQRAAAQADAADEEPVEGAIAQPDSSAGNLFPDIESLRSEVAALAEKSGTKEEFESEWLAMLTESAVGAVALAAMVLWGAAIYTAVANSQPVDVPLPPNVATETAKAILNMISLWFDPFSVSAPNDDTDFSDWVVARGLVGQRGPACAAVGQETDAAIAAVDARLEYALPSPEALGAVLPHLKLLLDGTDEPTEAEVHAALATLPDDTNDACNASTAVETLAAFKGNYAVLGEPVDANDDRGGIEVPHAVRWLPSTGAAGRAAARVATLEHVAARCTQLAESDATSTPVKAALREAAATLKLIQMAPLYATREAVAYDEPERSGCLTSSASAEHGILVTRPCAIVRGALSFPVDAGIARVACDRCATSVLGDAAEAKAAKAKYHEATLSVRTQARAKGRATNIYVAPPARELRFASAAATGAALSEDVEVTEDVTPDDFTTANWLRIVNRALVATSALVPENGAAVERVEGLLDAVGEEGVTAEQRRDGLWTEFRRHSAISQDRLWVFLRLLSGAVGGEVNEVITTADEATLRATKAIQDQRVQIAKRVSDMQAKIVETVVGSMAKDSKLTLDKNGNQLVVVDAEARKQLNDLASGESGRPFFEANVAVRNLQSSDSNAPKPTLSQLLASLSQVGGQMQRSLEQTLTQPGTASASLAELSHPANCYFVTLRPDAVAAIRIAHERMNVELGLRGAGRRLSLWETVEGGCTMLTTRFAEFAGHVLVQARSTTGASAMYVSPQAMNTNAIQARVALERLVHASGAYTMSVSAPNWTALRHKNSDLGKARAAIMDAGSSVEDHAVGMMMRRALHGTPMQSRLSTHRHASGWEVVGLATR
jgi:hypothetical protein